MPKTYTRPQTVPEALKLLAQPHAFALGGGTYLNSPAAQAYADEATLIDLQALGLNAISERGRTLEIGATAPLESLLQTPQIPPALQETLRLQASLNLRNMATAAGSLLSADGRAPFAIAMLALDSRLTFADESQCALGDVLPLPLPRLRGTLVTAVEIPLNVELAYQQVARTPADLPIIAVAICRWQSGRTRVVLGGWSHTPALALDGPEPGGIEAAVRNVCESAGDDWATAEYRSEVAITLVQRCLATLPTP
ncbi:MAG: hypothetical protein OHK0052_24600 [Anaerolineales bacterium]